MTRINLLSGFAVSALTIGATSVCAFATATWSGAVNSDWNNASNWDHKPSAGEDIVIADVTNQPQFAGSGINSVGTLTLLAGATMQITSASSFTVEEVELVANAGTRLQVDGGSTFTINGGANTYDVAVGTGATLDVLGASQLVLNISSSAATAVHGEIFLGDNTRLQVNHDITFAGSGLVRMHGSTTSDYSEIRISATKKLQSTLSGGIYTEENALIFGQSDMSGNVGRFENDSGVYVDAGGTLDVDAKIDGSDGEWEIQSAGELAFNYPSTALTGDVINEGLIVFNEDIATSGVYYCNGGDIDFVGTEFTYNYGTGSPVVLDVDQIDCM